MNLSLVAFDMDGTLVDTPSSWAEVHRYFGETNEESLGRFLRGEIDDQEFLRRDLALWRKHSPAITRDELARILAPVPLMPGAHTLFGYLRTRQIATAIVSGGLDVLAERVGRELGVDHVLANGFEVDADGRLTDRGIIRVPIKRKREVLARLQRELSLGPEVCAAVGNSDIDVGLFERCRVGIAFLPADDRVRSHATHVVTEKDLARVIPPLAESV